MFCGYPHAEEDAAADKKQAKRHHFIKWTQWYVVVAGGFSRSKLLIVSSSSHGQKNCVGKKELGVEESSTSSIVVLRTQFCQNGGRDRGIVARERGETDRDHQHCAFFLFFFGLTLDEMRHPIRSRQ